MTTSAAPAAAAGDRTWLDRAYAALPLTTIFIWLAALYAYQSWRHSSPWLFTDELELTQLSRSIAETGEAARRGEPHFFETLYTYLTAPAWWIDSTASAYDLVRYIGVFTMTAVVFPTYFLARTIVGKPAALFAATGHCCRARARLLAGDLRGGARVPLRGPLLLPHREGDRRADALVDRRRRRRLSSSPRSYAPSWA